MRFRSSIVTFVALLTLLAPVHLLAQHWKPLYYPTAGGGTVCPYFINTDTGFLFDHARAAAPGSSAYCYRTTNAGVDWYPTNTFDQADYSIRQIWFATRDRGYAVVDTAYGRGATYKCGLLFETTDCGMDWHQISPPWMDAHSVYATGHVIFVTALTNGFVQTQSGARGTFPFADSAAIYRSTDRGMTWDSMPAGPNLRAGSYLGLTEITGNRDSLVVVLAADELTQTYIIHSEDLGTTWSTEALENENMGSSPFELQAFCFPYSCNVVRVLDDIRLARLDSFAFYEGSPPFTLSSWKQVLDAETGGWYAGTNCAQYVSNANPNSPPNKVGFIRLKDGKISYVGGPAETEVDDADFRNVAVVGHGAVIYATPYFDRTSQSAILRSVDGGDGQLSAGALAPKLSFEYKAIDASESVDTLLVCDSGTIIVVDRNLACSIAKLDSVTLDGLDPSAYTLTTKRDAQCRGVGDTTFIGIRRGSLLSSKFTVTGHFTDDELNSIDTSFTRTLVRRAARLAFLFALPANAMSAHAGDTLVIPVTLAIDPDAPVTISGNTNLSVLGKYDQDMLGALGFTPTISGITSDAGTLSASSIRYILNAPAGFSVKTGDTIGIFRFVVRLADSMHSNFDFSVSALSSDDPRCIMTSATNLPIAVSLSPLCGDDLMRTFMLTHQLSLAIESVTPNPATDQVRIRYRNASSQDPHFQLIDALGSVRRQGQLPSTSSDLNLEVSGLPSGVYQLALTIPAGGNAFRRVVVNH